LGQLPAIVHRQWRVLAAAALVLVVSIYLAVWWVLPWVRVRHWITEVVHRPERMSICSLLSGRCDLRDIRTLVEGVYEERLVVWYGLEPSQFTSTLIIDVFDDLGHPAKLTVQLRDTH
jgi:hypothetical protein